MNNVKKLIYSGILCMFLCFCLANTSKAASTNYDTYKAGNTFSSIINLKDKGATNGSDISAILEDALKNSGTDGAPVIVYIPSGNYTLSGNGIVLPSNVVILAEADTTITKGSSNMFYSRTAENVRNVTIYGGTWNGSNTTTNMFNISNVKNAVFQNCTIQNAGQNGISFCDGSTGSVVNVEAKGCQSYGIGILGGANVTIQNSQVNGNAKNGISISGGSNASISGTSAGFNGDAGIAIYGSTATIDGCSMAGNFEGIYDGQSSTMTLRNSTVTANKEHGIVVSDSIANLNNYANNNVTANCYSGISITGANAKAYIVGNTFNGNGISPKCTGGDLVGHGIGVSENAYVEATSNQICNNSQCAISVFGKGTALIQANTLSNNGRHGIGASDDANMTVNNNEICNNGYNGVLLNLRTVGTMYGNHIANNAKLGISITDQSKATIKGNTIEGNATNISITRGDKHLSGASATITSNTIQNSKDGHGIGLAYGSTVKINGKNTIQNNAKNGVCVIGGSSAKINAGTVLYSNTKNGVFVSDEKSSVSITGATIDSNKNYGVSAAKKAKLTVKSSLIKDNARYGIIVADAGTKVTAEKNSIKHNGEIGIMLRVSCTATSIASNRITDHTKYGIAAYTKSNAKSIKNNSLFNNGKYEFFQLGAKTSIQPVLSTTVKEIKSNSKKIKGTANKNAKVYTKVSGKSYNVKANKKGNYTFKISKKAKVNDTISVYTKDKAGNKYYADWKVVK